jgi:hypothetical protein
MALTRASGSTFALRTRAGVPDAPRVTAMPAATLIAWSGDREVRFEEKVVGRAVTRRVDIDGTAPNTVMSAIVGRPLRDLVRLPGDPGMVAAAAEHTPTGFAITLAPWTDATILPEAE